MERRHRRGNVLFRLPAAVFSSLLPACVGGISTTASVFVLPTGQPASFPLRGPGSDVTPPPPLREGLPGTLGAQRRPSHRPPQRRSQSQLCLCRCQWQQPSRAPSPPSHSVPPPNAGHCCRDNVQRRHRGQARHHCGRIGGVCVGQGKDAAGSQDRRKLSFVFAFLWQPSNSNTSQRDVSPPLSLPPAFRQLSQSAETFGSGSGSWHGCPHGSAVRTRPRLPLLPPSFPPFSFRLHFLSLTSPSPPLHYLLLLVPDRPAASPV